MKGDSKVKIENYSPYPGFLDLRDYELPKRDFMRWWKVQDMLTHMQKRAEYFKKYHPAQWQKAQEISAEYNMIIMDLKVKRRLGQGVLEI